MEVKLTQHSKELNGSLESFIFHVGQFVWCYWKTAKEKERAYFEAHITEVWEDAAAVTEISEVDQRRSDEFVVDEDIRGEGEISHLMRGLT